MNIISNWENQKAILKGKFKRLTDADLDFEESRRNEMLSKLALKLGMTTREILQIIERGHIQNTANVHQPDSFINSAYQHH
jgi:hypothetical protein